MPMLTTRHPKDIHEVALTDCQISLEEFIAVVRYDAKVILGKDYIDRVNASRKALERRVAEGAPIYGVNTGFGDNVRYKISEEDLEQMQVNILRSHACSVGEPLTREKVRAIQLMMLISNGMGYSAIRIEPLRLLCDMMNCGIVPYAPGDGSLGGLTVEPHIALTLIGEGRVVENGKIIPAMDVLNKHDLKPVKLKCKEGLSLIAGTSQITAFAAIAVYDYIQALRMADITSAIVFEALCGTDRSLLDAVHRLKNHKEQIETAAFLRKLLAGSEILEKSRDLHVQDCTALRLIPHVHGAAKRIAGHAYGAIMEELHAVSDNPIVYPNGEVYMGAGFDATLIGTQCDCMVVGAVAIAKLLEAFMERLVNAKLSGLPPFLIKNPGVNSGFMIVQYVSAGLQSDISLMSIPASSDTVTSSADQENPASMAYTCARKACIVMEKIEQMLALTMMTSLQAVDFIEDAMSPATRDIHDAIRESVSFMEDDETMYVKIEETLSIVRSGVLQDITMKHAGEFTI